MEKEFLTKEEFKSALAELWRKRWLAPDMQEKKMEWAKKRAEKIKIKKREDPEWRERMKEAGKKRWANMSDEHKEKMSNPRLGTKHSEETKRRLSEIGKKKHQIYLENERQRIANLEKQNRERFIGEQLSQ